MKQAFARAKHLPVGLRTQLSVLQRLVTRLQGTYIQLLHHILSQLAYNTIEYISCATHVQCHQQHALLLSAHV